MTSLASAPPAGVASRLASDRALARATATITAWNLVSRLTGFARVVATGAALGATALGDTYQSANLVSNILFELLAGGMLSSVLVPTFVGLIDRDRRADAARLAGGLLGKTLAGLSLLVLAGMLASTWVMRLLTAGVDDGRVHDQQVRLGAFLLWFFLPQILLYAAGAVATALLNADRRFTAAAIAPVFNNAVVITTMVAFRAMRHGSTGFDLAGSEKVVLALGTSAGVLVMTVVPLLAVWRGGIALVPRWRTGAALRPLARKGLWAAGHLGLNQLLVAVTIVLAARVHGGVIAYQIAFTFFLLPHAVLSNPIFTALYPRLAADAAAGRTDEFAADLATGLRYTAFLLLPASALLAATARPVLDAVRLGALDTAGAGLVAAVLAAYAIGLLGYSAFFLLTRAAYALDDVRGPTIVNLWATAAAVGAMVVASSATDGRSKVVVLGLVHAGAVTVGSVALLARVRGRLGRPILIGRALSRDVVAAAIAGACGWAIVEAVASRERGTALLAVAAAVAVGTVVYAIVQRMAGAPELRSPLHAFAREPTA